LLTPWAKAKLATRKEPDDPYFFCLPGGPLRITGGFGWRLVQHPTTNSKYIFMLQEGNAHTFRQIFMDGRKHPADPSPTWYGHSIGRWDGDTLVVDTIGVNVSGSIAAERRTARACTWSSAIRARTIRPCAAS
jgi:hypothetical protein